VSQLNVEIIQRGMNNSELMAMAKNKKLENGRSPWAYWESERNSFGKTFRKVAWYPSFFPLFFSSDHGVTPGVAFEKSETQTKASLYLSWNEKKVRELKDTYGVNAVHCKNPWIDWRKSKFPIKNSNAKGSLIFWPHTHPTVTTHINLETVRQALDALPESFKPFTIMLVSHDVMINRHVELRELGLPIVTAGSIMSQNFVDNFYSIINEFKYAVSLTWGSHIFYCLEFNMPVTLIAPSAVAYESLGTPEIPAGFYDHTDVRFPDPAERLIFDKWMDSLSQVNERVKPDQLEYALDQLGVFAKITRINICRIVWKQFFLNFYKIPILWLQLFPLKMK
jgi:hypothetical protein